MLVYHVTICTNKTFYDLLVVGFRTSCGVASLGHCAVDTCAKQSFAAGPTATMDQGTCQILLDSGCAISDSVENHIRARVRSSTKLRQQAIA